VIVNGVYFNSKKLSQPLLVQSERLIIKNNLDLDISGWETVKYDV
jgi:hypothetical protein